MINDQVNDQTEQDGFCTIADVDCESVSLSRASFSICMAPS